MIASVRGTVIDKGVDYVVIENTGVGYHCFATANTLAGLKSGSEVFLLTSLAVRDEVPVLYGFATAEERSLFHLLQKVTGVGARLALAVLAVFDPAELAQAIESEDSKAVQRAPGVGKRMAERLVVELKGKVTEFLGAAVAESAGLGDGATGEAAGGVDVAGNAGGAAAATAAANADVQLMENVVAGMESLGFNHAEASELVRSVVQHDPTMEWDAALLLRECLRAAGSSPNGVGSGGGAASRGGGGSLGTRGTRGGRGGGRGARGGSR